MESLETTSVRTSFVMMQTSWMAMDATSFVLMRQFVELINMVNPSAAVEMVFENLGSTVMIFWPVNATNIVMERILDGTVQAQLAHLAHVSIILLMATQLALNSAMMVTWSMEMDVLVTWSIMAGPAHLMLCFYLIAQEDAETAKLILLEKSVMMETSLISMDVIRTVKLRIFGFASNRFKYRYAIDVRLLQC